MQPQALCFGEILFDRFHDGDKLGGAALNCAWYLTQLGIRTAMISAVGQDPAAKTALCALDAARIDRSAVAQLPAPTGIVDITLTDGQPSYTIRENAAWDAIPLPTPVPNADLLYFGTLSQRAPASRATLQALLANPYAQTFFDVNLRGTYFTRECIENGLAHADVTKVNADEWTLLQSMLNLTTPAALLTRYQLKGLLITRGADGAEWHGTASSTRACAPPTAVNDAVGAGDAFSAVICTALVRGIPIPRVLQHACNVGAHVVGHRGAQLSLPPPLRTLPTH